MTLSLLVAFLAPEAPAPTDNSVNLWGALGCAVAFAGALFAVLDALGDYALARSSKASGWESTSQRLKFGSKLSAAGITAASAGTVLALDGNWFALAALGLVFLTIILWSLVALLRRENARGNATSEAALPEDAGST